MVRKYSQRKATHNLVADKIIRAYNDKTSDFYYSSLKLLRDTVNQLSDSWKKKITLVY